MLTNIPLIIAISISQKFLFLTDIHYDPLYSVNSPNKCALGSTGLGCCHKYDLPLLNSQRASKWGDYNCDTSPVFIDKTLSWISNNTNIDFIIYTGDSAGHHDFSNTPSVIKRSMSDIQLLFKTYFPNKPIYNNLGNHDTWPIDQTVPFEYKKILEFTSKTWYDKKYFDDMFTENVKKGGYYSVMLNNFTRIISFNSIYYDNNNLFKRNLDNDNQIYWLKTILDKSRNNKEQVWFISHIFPTAGESTNKYNNIMKKIFWDYRDVIKYQWYGHSHNDQFILFKNNLTNEIYMNAVVGPSIMPDKRFPAFRIYEYDQSKYSLIDYTQYYCNLSEVIENNKLTYTKQYSIKNLYNLSGIETNDYIELHNKLNSKYYKDLYCNQYTPGFNKCSINNIVI